MPNIESIVLGFDWGMKRIGVAVGNILLEDAKPLKTLPARSGLPDWTSIKKITQEWRPKAFIVGVPSQINGKALYTTELAENFCAELKKHFDLPVYPVDERLTTVEARQQLFDVGGYRKIQSTEVDSFAAKLMVEQWFFEKKMKNSCPEVS